MINHNKYKKINKYLKALKLSSLEDSFLIFLEKGNSLSDEDINKLLKLIKFKEHDSFNFEFKKIIEKNINKNSSSARVKKYRDSTKSKGYKNLSLLLPPGTYQMLKDLKLKNKMTYAELIDFLVSSQK